MNPEDAELLERQRQREPIAAARAEDLACEISPKCDMRSVEKTFDKAARSPRARKRIKLILQAADQWVAPWMSASACRSGCSHCCSLPSIVITAAEANLIADHSGREAADPGSNSMPILDLMTEEGAQRAAQWDQGNDYNDVPCPFLAQGMCSVYEVRPLVCRTKINADDDPLLCERVKGHPVSVPYLDTRPLWAASMSLLMHDRLADIRDFFPVERPADISQRI